LEHFHSYLSKKALVDRLLFPGSHKEFETSRVRPAVQKRHNADFVIRVLPVLCIAAGSASEQFEEKMPVR